MSDEITRLKIGKSFGQASHSYDISARLQRYSGKQLMPWLPDQKDLQVVDLGCGTGFFTEILADHYHHVLGVDISQQMLLFSKQKRNSNINWLVADAYNLPLKDNSVDLIYSNLMIQWCLPFSSVIDEILRVLKPGGAFIFSTLVDGTLYELKSSWAQVDNDKHVIDFKPSKNMSTCLQRHNAKLLKSDTKNIILEYENVLHLARELKGLGANNVSDKKRKGLAGKDKWKQMNAAYQDFQEPNGIIPATYCLYSGVLVKLND